MPTSNYRPYLIPESPGALSGAGRATPFAQGDVARDADERFCDRVFCLILRDRQRGAAAVYASVAVAGACGATFGRLSWRWRAVHSANPSQRMQ